MKAASLTSALLVAKGAAAPAGFAVPADLPATHIRGGRRPSLVLTAGSGATALRGGARGGARAGVAPALAEGERPVRVSFRLDRARHLRLKLIAAHRGQSLRACLIEAVALYLDHIAPSVMNGCCNCITGQDDHDD